MLFFFKDTKQRYDVIDGNVCSRKTSVELYTRGIADGRRPMHTFQRGERNLRWLCCQGRVMFRSSSSSSSSSSSIIIIIVIINRLMLILWYDRWLICPVKKSGVSHWCHAGHKGDLCEFWVGFDECSFFFITLFYIFGARQLYACA